MRAMVLQESETTLHARPLPMPTPTSREALIAVEACGVCRTDLHIADHELPPVLNPLIPGHQIVGTVVASSSPALPPGLRVGVPWLAYTCGRCDYCRRGRENLCDAAEFTGYTRPGGFAEFACADVEFCFPLSDGRPAAELAPLLCAGLIGYRALGMCAGADRIGLFGFGAAAHILAQVLRHERREFFAFTRAGDERAMRAARELGAAWAGASTERPPASLDAAIIFAPVGALVPLALSRVRKGGRVVCGGIHMSKIPAFSYDLLWGERELRSVANLTRRDGTEFLALAERIQIRTEVTRFPLAQANDALDVLRRGQVTGSVVLEIGAIAAAGNVP
jgi:propanol-preferring alcohol dehydrogenase